MTFRPEQVMTTEDWKRKHGGHRIREAVENVDIKRMYWLVCDDCEAKHLRKMETIAADDCETCGEPCSYGARCKSCDEYWQRMIDEKLYEPGVGWTERGRRAATYLGSM